eukprot:509488-Pelagomonas_calceolata.AAC.1
MDTCAHKRPPGISGEHRKGSQLIHSLKPPTPNQSPITEAPLLPSNSAAKAQITKASSLLSNSTTQTNDYGSPLLLSNSTTKAQSQKSHHHSAQNTKALPPTPSVDSDRQTSRFHD